MSNFSDVHFCGRLFRSDPKRFFRGGSVRRYALMASLPPARMAQRLPLMLGIGRLYGAIERFGRINAQLRALPNVQVAALYGVPY
jgi:hypothetical protein